MKSRRLQGKLVGAMRVRVSFVMLVATVGARAGHLSFYLNGDALCLLVTKVLLLACVNQRIQL